MLCALARKPGHLVTKDDLLDAVWGHRFVTDSVLKSAISDVRAALQRRPETAALHRDGVAPRLSLHRRYRWRAQALRRGAETTRAVPDHPTLAALTALCRGDAALADLIRMVAATLERERLLTNS